jgi:hypothetical protein
MGNIIFKEAKNNFLLIVSYIRNHSTYEDFYFFGHTSVLRSDSLLSLSAFRVNRYILISS